MENIKNTIQLFSLYTEKYCRLCDEKIDPSINDDISIIINHYVQKHDYKLLYVGGHTIEAELDGDHPIPGVTIVLGSEVVPDRNTDKIPKEFIFES